MPFISVYNFKWFSYYCFLGGFLLCTFHLITDEKLVEPLVKYPIDDLLVKPAADDPILSNRPPLSKDFRVPLDSVGDLLMVWDFCLSFGRVLCLSPFSLSDLENAICTKESNLVLVVEIHSALLRLLIKYEGEYFTILQKKKKILKVISSHNVGGVKRSCLSFSL